MATPSNGQGRFTSRGAGLSFFAQIVLLLASVSWLIFNVILVKTTWQTPQGGEGGIPSLQAEKVALVGGGGLIDEETRRLALGGSRAPLPSSVGVNGNGNGNGERRVPGRPQYIPSWAAITHGRDGRVLYGASSTRMHGIVGYAQDGNPGWEPQPKPASDLNMVEALREGGGFNLRLSDALPLDRNLSDSRHNDCKTVAYRSEELQTASVIIVFYNEPFSTLMRSVHSVLNLTPPDILQEVILVDDGSSLPWITSKDTDGLERYVELLNKSCPTLLVRNPVRKGIVGARMAGIRAATAPVFVILDSHIEVMPVWLEPLVARIKDDRRRVLMPQVDGLNAETFVEDRGGVGCTLGFLWKLIEHAFDPNDRSPPERRQKRPTEFVSSPTMAGGLFAADREFFMEIGAYDEQFQYWGTENLELSFRLWTCGGMLECAPCSRVYHIFRKGGQGYSSPVDAVTKNKMRLLTIWMDEYADLAWRVIGNPRVNFGTYELDLQWRKDHNCKSFKWFLENVNPESDVLAIPRDVPYLGPIRNKGGNVCLDTGNADYPGQRIILHDCHGKRPQQFMFFKNRMHIMPVANDEACLGDGTDPHRTGWCHPQLQRWDVDMTIGQLRHNTLGKCLAAEAKKLIYSDCDPNDEFQQWEWPKYDPPTVFTPPPPPRFRGQEDAE